MNKIYRVLHYNDTEPENTDSLWIDKKNDAYQIKIFDRKNENSPLEWVPISGNGIELSQETGYDNSVGMSLEAITKELDAIKDVISPIIKKVIVTRPLVKYTGGLQRFQILWTYYREEFNGNYGYPEKVELQVKVNNEYQTLKIWDNNTSANGNYEYSTDKLGITEFKVIFTENNVETLITATHELIFPIFYGISPLEVNLLNTIDLNKKLYVELIQKSFSGNITMNDRSFNTERFAFICVPYESTLTSWKSEGFGVAFEELSDTYTIYDKTKRYKIYKTQSLDNEIINRTFEINIKYGN